MRASQTGVCFYSSVENHFLPSICKSEGSDIMCKQPIRLKMR